MDQETSFITMLRQIATDNGARGLVDDAAVLSVGGHTLILTHDILVEGVHFLPGTAPEDVAWKLVATNISDLAAKGATPLGVLLGYMLGEEEWDARFVKALGEALNHYDVLLLGGDTVGAPVKNMHRSYGLTAIGGATQGKVPSRSGARGGDIIYLCGTIGDAMLGYEALRDGREVDQDLIQSYLRPGALPKQGQALAPYVSAMMDVSDGLLLDSFRMAEASGLTFALDSAAIPLSRAARTLLSRLPEDEATRKRDAMLRWGDDYALLFTATASHLPEVNAVAIGRVMASSATPLRLDDMGIAQDTGLGFTHFIAE